MWTFSLITISISMTMIVDNDSHRQLWASLFNFLILWLQYCVQAVWPKIWAQYLKISLNVLKNIHDIIPSVHRVLPRGPFLPLLDEIFLPKTGSKTRTPGFTDKHTTTDLWSQAYIMYRILRDLPCNMT